MTDETILKDLVSYIKSDVSFEDAKEKAETLFLVWFPEAKTKEDLLKDIRYFLLTYGHYPKEWELPFFISHPKEYKL